MDKTFSKMNKTLSVLESSQKRVDQQFKNIASSVDSVSRREKGLQGIHNQMDRVSKTTRGAKEQVDLLGRSLGGLKSAMGALAGFIGIYKIMQGVGAVGGSALDFEKQAKSLQQSNLSPEFQKRLISQSLSLGSSGKYAMSGSDFLSTFKEIRSVSKSPEAALEDLPLIGRLDMQMRMVDKKLKGQAALLPRFFEKFAAFDSKGKLTVADALLKGVQYTGGQVNPAQILQQISTSGTSVVGGDPYKEIVEQIYSIKESAAGAGHGGGGSTGRGRGGVGRQAIDRIVNLGIITPAMANMMKEAGMLEGIQAAGTASGHKTLIDGISGKHVLTRGGKGGTGSLKTSDVHAFLLRSRPEWMRLHANDPEQIGLDFVAGADALGGNKIPGTFMQTRDAHLKHFSSLPVDQQKSLEGQLMAGARMTGIDFIMERSVGRYLQSHNILTQGIKDQPGLAATGQLSVMDRWDKLMKSIETFGNALGNDGSLITMANTALDALTGAIKTLTENVAPIAKNLADLVPKTATEAAGMFGGAVAGGAVAGPGGALVGGTVGSMVGGVSDMVLHSVDEFKKTPVGKDLYKWGKKNFAPIAGRGTVLVPPPPPYVPSMVDPGMAKYYGVGGPGALPMTTGQSSKHGGTVINQTFNVHPLAGIDGEKIKKQVADAVAPHLQRQQLKTARKMSYATSAAGGSYTDKTHNAGSGP